MMPDLWAARQAEIVARLEWNVSRLLSRDARRAKPKREAERQSFRNGRYQSGNRKLHPRDALAFCLRYSA
jgi:hypothetical protein